MLNLGCLERKKKERIGDAERPRKGYCPFSGLGRDVVLCVATWFEGCRRFLGRDKSFLVRDKASWLYVATWFSLCHDMVFSFKLWKMLQHGVSLLRQVWAWLGISRSR